MRLGAHGGLGVRVGCPGGGPGLLGLPDRLTGLVDAGWRVLALTPAAEVRLHEIAPPTADERVAVLVGAEGPGLAEATLSTRGVERVRIAMAPTVDSVNVAAAASIALAHLRSPTLA